MEIVLIILGIIIIVYLIFLNRTRTLYKLIDKLNHGDEESIIVNQTLEQILNTIKAQSKNINILKDENTFLYKKNKYKITPYDNKVYLTIIKNNPKNDALIYFKNIEKFINNKLDSFLFINTQINALIEKEEDIFSIIQDIGYTKELYQYTNNLNYNDKFKVLNEINIILKNYNDIEEYYFRLYLINYFLEQYPIINYIENGIPKEIIKIKEDIDGIVILEIFNNYLYFNFTNTLLNQSYIDKYDKVEKDIYYNKDFGSIEIYKDYIKEVPIKFNHRCSDITLRLRNNFNSNGLNDNINNKEDENKEVIESKNLKDLLKKATRELDYEENRVKEIINEVKSNLPIKIDDVLTFKQIFGDEETIWIICYTESKESVKNPNDMLNLLIRKIQNKKYIRELKELECNIFVQILASNQQNIITGHLYKRNN